MSDGIVIAQNADRSEDRPCKQQRKIFLLERELFLRPEQNNKRKDQCNEIPEKAFLHGGQITGKLDKQVHQRKEKGGHEDEHNALALL